VPVGPDAVVWNLHRRYGRVRLPLMLWGWRVLDVTRWEPQRLDVNVSVTLPWEPVWVLTPDPALTPGSEAEVVGQPLSTFVPVPQWLSTSDRAEGRSSGAGVADHAVTVTVDGQESIVPEHDDL